jgi:hypothetical protein
VPFLFYSARYLSIYVMATSETEETCSICLDSPTNPVKTPCLHMFCRMCIGSWLDKKLVCPVCRVRIPAGKRELIVMRNATGQPRAAATAATTRESGPSCTGQCSLTVRRDWLYRGVPCPCMIAWFEVGSQQLPVPANMWISTSGGLKIIIDCKYLKHCG